jgi:acyl carrier protein
MDEVAVRVEGAVRDALTAIRPAAAGLDSDADLATEAGLDSVEVMDLVMEIEDRLDLSIPVETLSQAHTIRGLCAGILALSGGRS